MSTAGKGLEGVVVSESMISSVDGDIGKLYYRGYDLPELAARTSYEEVVHLLWYGALPTRSQLERLKQRLAENRALPAGAMAILRLMPTVVIPTKAGIQSSGSRKQRAGMKRLWMPGQNPRA